MVNIGERVEATADVERLRTVARHPSTTAARLLGAGDRNE
jgi:hypothetical protein